jgi:hypothetical protein
MLARARFFKVLDASSAEGVGKNWDTLSWPFVEVLGFETFPPWFISPTHS